MLKAALKAGREPPDRVVAAFSVWDHLLVYARAFDRLSAGRMWIAGGLGGATPVRVGYADLVAYARAHGFRGARFREFARFIDAQDDTFIAYHAKQAKQPTEPDDRTSDEPE